MRRLFLLQNLLKKRQLACIISLLAWQHDDNKNLDSPYFTDNLNTPDNMSKNTHTKLFKLQFSGAICVNAMGFWQNAITIFRWCIIAPLSPSRVFALVRFLRFSPALNQQIQLLLNRFALEDEGQQLHHILIGQDGRLFQKGLQHSGTSAKPMGSLDSGQPFLLVLQSLLLVLGCGQLPLRNILFVSQLFQW